MYRPDAETGRYPQRLVRKMGVSTHITAGMVDLPVAWREEVSILNWHDADDLLGKSFCTDFEVIAVGAATKGVLYDPGRIVTLQRADGTYEISLGELRQAVESGFVRETWLSALRMICASCGGGLTETDFAASWCTQCGTPILRGRRHG